jgi:hypothetical protein
MYSTLQRATQVAASLFLFALFVATGSAAAQSAGTSATVGGTVTDSTGAAIPGAAIILQNPVSGFSRKTTTDTTGHYQFSNVPLNPYSIITTAAGFSTSHKDVKLDSFIPVTANITLSIGATDTTIDVEAGDLTESDPTFHTDVDRGLFDKLPLESQSSGLSSLVTLASPGVSADSNGLFHGLGDHASNSFSIDGQSITDQQSKVFSNQLPVNAVQSVEVISGAPPAEYGGKTSLVINVTTRSGLGITKPTGEVTLSYGTFGSANGTFDISYGGPKWGNFFEIDGLNTGRFLDPPEFTVFHDKGNEFNVFDRVDRQITTADSVHLNVSVSRSWFQTPNDYDNLNVKNVISGGASPFPVLGSVGNADQRSQILTYNIAPGYTRTIGASAVFNFGAYVRRDAYNYYPSDNPLADKSAPNLQNQSIGQARSLTNAAVHSDLSYTHGINSFKIGGLYSQTFLRENDTLGVVSPYFNAPCVDTSGNAVAGFTETSQCANYGDVSNDPSVGGNFNPVLLPYDLTRGGAEYNFLGRTDIKELGLYAEDNLKAGNWLFNLGIRGDFYNGLTIQRQAEPRVGTSYTIKKSGTVLRASYARTLETPFNENLVLSSEGCANSVLNPLLLCSSGVGNTLQPGFRNEFHAGLQQTFGKHFVFSGDYIWKYTHNAFDFSVLGNTPITFPIDWHNSKIPGYALRADVPNFHNFTAYVVMSSVAARFFPPQVSGAGATVARGGVNYPFRIDHDEKFNETTHAQYTLPIKRTPWVGVNWRYDSGLVAGSAPCYNPLSNDPNSACGNTSILIGGQPGVNLSGLTADEQFQAGLICNGVHATLANGGFSQCLASQFSSNLINIPAPGTGNNDKNPPRIAPRNLFDASIGDDDLFKGDRYKWSLRLTGVNILNKYALYNFLSTFSGTHYVTPRALTAEVGFHF